MKKQYEEKKHKNCSNDQIKEEEQNTKTRMERKKPKEDKEEINYG